MFLVAQRGQNPKALCEFRVHPGSHRGRHGLSQLVHGEDRNEAIMRMRRALDEIRVEGVRTTVGFHKKIMVNSDFVEARLSTNFLEKQRP